jgi:methanogenic corrinoid protein MtbC1
VAAEELYAQMKQSVIDGESEDAERLAREGLDAGLSAGDILDLGFVNGIEEVGDLSSGAASSSSPSSSGAPRR